MAAVGGNAWQGWMPRRPEFAGPFCWRRETEKSSKRLDSLICSGHLERIAPYVEEVDTEELVEARPINGKCLTSLDPHSSYLSPKDGAKKCATRRAENSGGLGIEGDAGKRASSKCFPQSNGTPASEGGDRSGRFHHPCGWRKATLGLTLDDALN